MAKKQELILNADQVAKVAHEANRAYCQTIGDNSQPNWETAPGWQRQSAIRGVEFHVQQHNAGTVPSPSASHDSWLAEKREAGWKYGPVKDPEKKEHPCYIPYEGLPLEQRLKDYLFGAVVSAFIKAAQE